MHTWLNFRYNGSHATALLTAVALVLPALAGCGSQAPTGTSNPLATTTTLTANPTSASTGQSVTLTASVGAGESTVSSGTVNFIEGDTSLGTETVSGGTATLVTTSLPQGSDSVTAQYAANSTYAASVSGAVVVTITAAQPVQNTTIEVTPASLNFGNDRIPSGTELGVEITNSGSVALDLATLSLSSSSDASFSIADNLCGSTLAAGDSCTVEISFDSSATTSASGILDIAGNFTGSPQTVALSGTGATEPDSCSTTDTTSPAQPTPTANYSGAAFSGLVLAGTTPVAGSSVQLYAAGSTGNGSAPATLLGTALTTGSNGAFTVPAGYTCPYNNSVLYLVARGGQAGTSSTNSALALATVLGACDSITSNPTYTVNELTTAATAYAMNQFMSAGGNIGATATNTLGLTLAASTFSNLINPLSGAAPGAYFPSNGAAPSAKLDTVANILNGCVAGGASSTACTQLESLTTPALTAAPTNTLDAVMYLVQHPGGIPIIHADGGNNIAGLYALAAASTAFTPALSAAPDDWTLYTTWTGGGMSDPSAVSIDSTGRVWVANYNSVASLFSNTGAPVFTGGLTGNALYNSYGGTVDVNDVEWVTNEQDPGGPDNYGSVTLLNSSGNSPAIYSAGGLNFPIGIAMDTSGTAWIANYGNSSLTLLSNSGAALSGTSGYSSNQYAFPVAVATDSKCNGFIANQSSNNVTFTSADGTIFGSYVTGEGPSGVAVDANDNVWVANYFGSSIGLVSSAGQVVSGASGYTGGGIDHPQGIAIDGNGNVWVANYRGPALTELAGANATTPGAALSPSAGFAPDASLLEAFALAIDPAGNVWVTNFGSNTLTEFIGMAAPVKTPLLGPVRMP